MHPFNSNGQVGRFQSTLTEIARCIKIYIKVDETIELILIATVEYDKTLNSVTKLQPKYKLYTEELVQEDWNICPCFFTNPTL